MRIVLERGKTRGRPVLAAVLRPLESLESVAGVRTGGVGLLGGAELTDLSKLLRVIDPAPALLLRGILGVALQISPPFVISDGEPTALDESLAAVRA